MTKLQVLWQKCQYEHYQICRFLWKNGRKQQGQNYRPKISVVKGYFNNVEEIKIHNYLCKFAKCRDICFNDKATMTKDKKFQLKWIFDTNLA